MSLFHDSPSNSLLMVSHDNMIVSLSFFCSYCSYPYPYLIVINYVGAEDHWLPHTQSIRLFDPLVKNGYDTDCIPN